MPDLMVAATQQLLVLAGCAVTGAFAEIVDFTDIPMPGRFELDTHHLLHVYANENAFNQNASTASVTFKNFEIEWCDGQDGIGDYKSLQVSLVPLSKFSKLVSETNFCSGDRKVTFRGEVPVFDVGSSREASFFIRTTDAYLLIVTNCGDRGGATVTKGEVIVNQAHGHLPGNKICTLQWWGWFTIISAFLCIRWAVASARHYKTLMITQKMIAILAALAFLEAASTYWQYWFWNKTGTESMRILVASMFLYSMKFVLTLSMLVETATGSGVTTERLVAFIEVKLFSMSLLVLLAHWTWKIILSYKYSLMLNTAFVLAITIPGTVLWLVMFLWVYRKFQPMLPTLQNETVSPKAKKALMSMRWVLVGSILLATGVLLLQFADIVLSNTPWNLQWVAYDAAPHTVYTLFLLTLMILWWPDVNSGKSDYSLQTNEVDDEIGEDDQIQAEQIGVPEAASEVEGDTA